MRTFHGKIPNRNLDGMPDSQRQACATSPAGISPAFHRIHGRIGATPAGHLVTRRMASPPGHCASESAHRKDSLGAHPAETCVGCCDMSSWRHLTHTASLEFRGLQFPITLANDDHRFLSRGDRPTHSYRLKQCLWWGFPRSRSQGQDLHASN